MVKLGNQIQVPYQWETLMLVKHHPNIPTLQTCIKKHKKVKMSTFVKRVIKISGDMIVLNICTLLTGFVRKLRVVCLQVSLDHYDNNKTKSRWGSFIAPLVWGGAILQNSQSASLSQQYTESISWCDMADSKRIVTLCRALPTFRNSVINDAIKCGQERIFVTKRILQPGFNIIQTESIV